MRHILVLGLVLALTFISFIPRPEDKVVFLDVGQGDAILLQDGTQQVLIDGGQGMAVLERLGEELPWFDKRIEVVMVTHPQRDHLEGLLHVLERYDVGVVLLPRAAHSSQLQQTWLKKIRDGEIPYRFAWSGQKLQVGDITFHFVGPLDSPVAEAATRADLNNASIMTRVDYCPNPSGPTEVGPPPLIKGGTSSSPSLIREGDRGWVCLSFLLTGDAEKRVETLLVAETEPALLDVDILKAGHHGSNSSTHEPLIQAASPHAAVISVGAENKFGHPRQEVLDRLAGIPIWRTDQHGSVKFVYTKRGWYIDNHD